MFIFQMEITNDENDDNGYQTPPKKRPRLETESSGKQSKNKTKSNDTSQVFDLKKYIQYFP